VKPGKYDLPKNIDIIYFDGTFKAKLDSGLHYNILFFATLSKEIHKLVHLGFVISFSSTHAEYMNIWKGIEKYYTNCGYSCQNTCFMSDVGPSELKFANLYNEIFHFWCWFHVKEIFAQCSVKHGGSQRGEIYKIITLIYYSKTLDHMSKYVAILKSRIQMTPLLYEKIWKYFSSNKNLNKWAC
jgi:hypothetical protein